MKQERAKEIEFLRSEIIGPSRSFLDCGQKDLDGNDITDKVEFDGNNQFIYPSGLKGPGFPVYWRNTEKIPWQEVIHYGKETPLNSYGAGLLFPGGIKKGELIDVSNENINLDTDIESTVEQEISSIYVEDDDFNNESPKFDKASAIDGIDDDFDVTSPDVFYPSTMGVSFCVKGDDGFLVISLPTSKSFFWQNEGDESFQVNGRYEKCEKKLVVDGVNKTVPAWKRLPATNDLSFVKIAINKLSPGQKLPSQIKLSENCPLSLLIEIFPRKIKEQWIITVVLRNTASITSNNSNEAQILNTLFQTYFEVGIEGSEFSPYPEGVRPFDQFDADEKSLALLYHDASTWAIGHGCAAGWDANLAEVPKTIYADVLPAVELPSMTPDIKDEDGNPITLSMRELAELPVYNELDPAWVSLNTLLSLYDKWIQDQNEKISKIDKRFEDIAKKHMDGCSKCNQRISSGIELLKHNETARLAFKLANKSMLLQQIASKTMKKRSLHWNGEYVAPKKSVINYNSPADIFNNNAEQGLGSWRAFQIAFLLMSLDGLVNDKKSPDRDVVDLIWFPTGGGKTEAYLGVAAFYMFHQRLLMSSEVTGNQLKRDGTNVFMRYTLRMLTTQQFQRAASLICAMEYIRKEYEKSDALLGKTKFTLGLWIGQSGSPNKCDAARTAINKFKKKDVSGNPLVITECPWCKSEIGKLESKPDKISQQAWSSICLAGIVEINQEPVVKCSDPDCDFGGDGDSLPIEVIDERIYRTPPSMLIGTADKFAMMAYRPEAGSLFGRKHSKSGEVIRDKRPPGLIIQDEFHLISGPLGTIYGVYEGIIEELCTTIDGVKPKIIASTATIKGAQEQVKSIFARQNVQLFPSPALLMKDSFFGRYETLENSEVLASGRLYLGIHAHSYGSFLTTQVRAFTALLFRSCFFDDQKKDAWWTLLAFYNSLRELGGARTLFDSDIASRLGNYSYRYGLKQRYLDVEELTSRKSQAELVHMMDRLGLEWDDKKSLDVCLASNIIEVGVDIDRLSLMAVVGQPKSTAQYIQVTGRVGRNWKERPGLILAMYNPAKSRDRSHLEQFHSYHRRLYERVEPTTATPFSIEAIERAMTGALLLWARQFYDSQSPNGYFDAYKEHLKLGYEILLDRCISVIIEPDEQARVSNVIVSVYEKLLAKWKKNPQMWEEYPQKNGGEYLMLWPGQFATPIQKKRGETVLSSMRNVDYSAYLQITDRYF